jgi:hypothetical protein
LDTFTPFSSLLGGLLIGAAVAVLILLNGRIAGISGIVAGLLSPQAGGRTWRLLFLAGLIGGAVLAGRLGLGPLPEIAAGWPLLLVAGLLVGFGTRLGGGCTSGHGVCGLARLSPRSLAATAVFMAAGMASVLVLQHLVGACKFAFVDSLVSGMMFGFGLVLSGMANPEKVLRFLDLAAIPSGGWDPSLAFVMGGALIVSAPAFALARRRSRPLFAETVHLPEKRGIDRPLILGSALFGIGWGLVGFCPGPAIAALGLDGWQAPLFVLAMLAGMAIKDRVTRA